MRFRVSKNTIVQAINIVKEAVASRTTNPILKTVMVEAKEDGWLSLRATNNILDITAEVKAEIEIPGKVCMSDLLISLLPTFGDAIYQDNVLTNPLQFEFTEKGLVVIQGKRKHRPTWISPDDFPKKLEITDYEVIQEKAVLIEAFQRMSIAVGVTEDRRILQGFHINPHNQEIVVGDGVRVYFRENIALPGNIADPPARLVMPILSNLTTMSDKDILEAKLGGLLAFKGTQIVNEEPYLKWEIIINGLDGDFPTTPKKLIEEAKSKKSRFSIKTNRQLLTRVLEVCNIYSKRAFDEGKSVHTILTKNGSGVMFSMHVPDLVEMEEPLECEYEGDDFRFLFHPGLTLEALGTMKSDTVELQFFGEEAPFLMLDGSQFTYLQGAMKENKKASTKKEEK